MGDGLDLGPLEAVVSDLEVYDATPFDETAARIADREMVFTNKNLLDAALLDAAPALRFIGLTATGTDNVDLAMARHRGIAVANIRAYCTASLVEHVFGVLLMLTHSLGRFNASVAAGEWQQAGGPFLLAHPVRELSAMILVSGFNVYPNEVENVVVEMEGVLEAAAIGLPDERSGEVVKIFAVRTSEDVTEEAVIAYCKDNLTGYKCPKSVEFRDDLPKTNVGKILRRKLREEVLAAE